MCESVLNAQEGRKVLTPRWSLSNCRHGVSHNEVWIWHVECNLMWPGNRRYRCYMVQPVPRRRFITATLHSYLQAYTALSGQPQVFHSCKPPQQSQEKPKVRGTAALFTFTKAQVLTRF